MSADAREQVRSYVRTALRFPELPDDADLFEAGGGSSLFAAELVLFVEDVLGVPLDDDDLVRENFASVDAVVALVDRRRGGG